MKLFAIIVLSCWLVPLSVFAIEGTYLSGTVGAASFDDKGSFPGEKMDNDVIFGLRGGLAFTDHWTLGLYLMRFKTDSEGPFDVESSPVLIEAAYYFGTRYDSSLWVSGLVGWSDHVHEFQGRDTDPAAGLALGYNWQVIPDVTLGPQFSYVYTFTNSQSAGSDNSVAAGQVNLTAWF